MAYKIATVIGNLVKRKVHKNNGWHYLAIGLEEWGYETGEGSQPTQGDQVGAQPSVPGFDQDNGQRQVFTDYLVLIMMVRLMMVSTHLWMARMSPKKRTTAWFKVMHIRLNTEAPFIISDHSHSNVGPVQIAQPGRLWFGQRQVYWGISDFRIRKYQHVWNGNLHSK